MPLSYKQTDSEISVVLWHINESEDYFTQKTSLSDKESEFLQKISHPKRRIEWLASRFLLQNELNITDIIAYLPSGKPVLSNQFISISHSFEMVGVMVSKKLCALDIEKVTPRILKVAHRAFSDQELIYAQSSEQLTVYWCCKETIFKLFDDENVDFKRDIIIEPVSDFNEGDISAHYLKKNHYLGNIKLKTVNGYKVTWLTYPPNI
ncbi:MAG TPA: 4'-phosphopantetheinyl transferase superfamily protein [Salinivirgaceae bacterium]|nr:4'-phosphopantetheinyl transferase superfamily protein [Salinivirgaceae bacterium]